MRFGGGSGASTESVQMAKADMKILLQAAEVVPRQVMEQEAITLRQEIAAETPLRHGALENSVYARVIKLGRHKFTLSAGANARNPKTGYNYAKVQHDSWNFHHPIKGKAHYVADPFDRAIDRLEARISAGLEPRR